MGWDRFIEEANLTEVSWPVSDPGNPGHLLFLYRVPRTIAPDTNVLLCYNATPERDGTRRRFGLLVPSTCTTPVAAAAWGFGLTAEQYSTMTHAY